jgi:hypothetical protein
MQGYFFLVVKLNLDRLVDNYQCYSTPPKWLRKKVELLWQHDIEYMA